MRIKAFGGLVLEEHEFRRPKPLLVGAYLCLEGATSRRRLAELFWPDAVDARDSMTTTLRRLNTLESEPLVGTGDPVEPLVACDVIEFLAAVSAADHARALALYSGRFLAGTDLRVGEEIEEWIYTTAERMASLARLAHLELALAAREERDLPLASRHAESALDLDNSLTWHEDQIVTVMEHLQAAGNPRAYEAQALAQTLGVAYSLPAGHGSAASAGANLPRPGTSFIGREAELEEIDAVLFSGVARLLTLHGPGGAGKSRLAMEAAQLAIERDSYPGGVYFVRLEEVAEDEQITTALAAAMRLVMPPAGDPDEHIIRIIGSRSLLIVLDNFEHVMNNSTFVATLLRSCPNVDILVTSRLTLGLGEEHIVALAGLKVDGPAGDSEALRLLFARMRQHGTIERVTAEDELAAHEICLEVDGSPLAIELAASQTRLSPLRELAVELRRGIEILVSRDPTAPERQRSVEAALDISWELLAESDRLALAKVSVFQGGFRRQDARAVAAVDSAALQQLVEASLLRVLPSGRFERHPIVKQYSAARLAEDSEREGRLRRRHAEHFLGSLAARDYEIHSGFTALELSTWIEEEFPNLETALTWCVDTGRIDLIEGVALVLAHFAELRGRFVDVAKLLEAGVIAAEALGRAGLVVSIPNTLGALPFTLFKLGRYHDSIEIGHRALAAAAKGEREAYDWAVWAAHQGMCLSSAALGQFEQALVFVTKNVEDRVAVAPGAPITDRTRCIVDVTIATSLLTQAFFDLQVGALDAALTKLWRAVELNEPLRAPTLGYQYGTIGEIQHIKGEVSQARATLEGGLEISHETGFLNQVGHLLCELAMVHLTLEDFVRAEALAKQALESAVTSGDTWLEVKVRSRLGLVALRQDDTVTARERLLAALAMAETTNAVGFVMEAVLGMAELLQRDGLQAEAATLLAFVRGSPLATATIAALAAKELELVSRALEASEFLAAERKGTELSPTAAFELVGLRRGSA